MANLVNLPHGDPPYVIYFDQKYASRGMRYDTVEKAQEEVKYRRPGPYHLVSVPQEMQRKRLWTPDEAKYLRAHAERMFTDHDCGGDRSVLARENCQACRLAGYEPRGSDWNVKHNGPSVSNWERDYVQAGRMIPFSWRLAFEKSYIKAGTDNPAWQQALERDIRTFDILWGPHTKEDVRRYAQEREKNLREWEDSQQQLFLQQLEEGRDGNS